MERLSRLFEALKIYGFVILDENWKDFLNELRNAGIIHLFNIRKIGVYTVLELNTLSCEKDCSISCRDGYGVVSGDCYSECFDKCLIERFTAITRTLSQLLNVK